ncbi:MAG: cystathionine gamma-synthase [Acidimicrobiales bacterium]|nr:cystathionine gamma-synthase [Acidimicrobiales bacterium]
MAEVDGSTGHGLETLAIHAGQPANPLTGDVVVPIHQTSTYAQDGVGGLRSGYEYSRSANPTRTALEECLAALEGVGLDAAATGLAFASGLAAEDVVARALCEPGDHVLLPDDAYGGTYRLFARVLERWGLTHTAVPLGDLDAVAAAVTDRTRMIWCETPTNPLLNVADISGLAAIARPSGARLVVDNTFASPYLQRPLALGADVVVHSTTKYLGGHSDVVGGAAIATDPEVVEALRFHQNAVGSVPGPMDCWLVLRGIKTLGVRMDRHCDNAEAVVAMLADHPAVASVNYPGLADHPGHHLAASQMKRAGGMVSFRLHGGEDAALKVCESTRIFTLAESLGGVESLIEHPARMTHASVAGSALEVPSDLVRLSVGIETVDDLLADLEQAIG